MLNLSVDLSIFSKVSQINYFVGFSVGVARRRHRSLAVLDMAFLFHAETQRKKRAIALWRFLQAIAYYNFASISNISCSMN